MRFQIEAITDTRYPNRAAQKSLGTFLLPDDGNDADTRIALVVEALDRLEEHGVKAVILGDHRNRAPHRIGTARESLQALLVYGIKEGK